MEIPVGNENKDGGQLRRHSIRFGSRTLDLPTGRKSRMAIGIALVLGGLLWFLPFVGMWMLPLGLFVLSIDLHWARRLRRRVAVWFTRRFPKLAEKANGTSQTRLPDDGESE